VPENTSVRKRERERERERESGIYWGGGRESVLSLPPHHPLPCCPCPYVLMYVFNLCTKPQAARKKCATRERETEEETDRQSERGRQRERERDQH
jgi:hypothetical protein